jgi:CxxC motif-containing protein
MNEVTCIVCPVGCKIRVDIKGNKCKQGIDYATSEALNPKRVLTTSVLVEDGEWPLVSVKTEPVPKGKIFSILEKIKKMRVKAPINCGDILGEIDNISVIATRKA